eukprot:879002-Rhodomonas_salina.1
MPRMLARPNLNPLTLRLPSMPSHLTAHRRPRQTFSIDFSSSHFHLALSQAILILVQVNNFQPRLDHYSGLEQPART